MDQDRLKGLPQKKNRDKCRFSAQISSSSEWHIFTLSKAWKLSQGEVIDRIIKENAFKYEKDLFPEDEKNII